MFNFLESLLPKKNVLFLEGNHEVHLRNWGNDEPVKSRDADETLRQFMENGISKKRVREFYRRLGQMAYFNFDGKVYFVNHGGTPGSPRITTPSQDFIRGVGKYEDSEIIKETWEHKSSYGDFQIHAHRNTFNVPITQSEHSFNLCDKVEFGGYLRVLVLDKTETGFESIYVHNNTFDHDLESKFNHSPQAIKETAENSTEEEILQNIVSQFRGIPRLVSETKLGNISSFNFSRQAFYTKTWDNLTTRARGLFVNINTWKIVARSYEKFFNLGERSFTELSELSKMQFPVKAFVKENGFLGIVGYDEETDSLVYTSKSTTQGDHANWFKKGLLDCLEHNGLSENKLRKILKENNSSLVFECIEPILDPHIIKHYHPGLVLLDEIYRTVEFKKKSFESLSGDWSDYFCVKTLARSFQDYKELYTFITEVKDNYDYKFLTFRVEGFVFEDANGFMVKMKTRYYNIWKYLRQIKEQLQRGKPFDNSKAVQHEIEIQGVAFLKKLYNEKDLNHSIIEIRDMMGLN